MFETKVYSQGTASDGGPPIKILKHDWTDADFLYLDDDDILYFRWDASSYSQCLININPENYSFETPTTGNTEESGIEVRTLQTSYGVSCTKDGDVFTKDVVLFL